MDINALACDTGGTMPDWHGGPVRTLSSVGGGHAQAHATAARWMGIELRQTRMMAGHDFVLNAA